MKKRLKACVSGTWRIEKAEKFRKEAEIIGKKLAELNCELWTGGGRGFADLVAKSFLKNKGKRFVWVKVDDKIMKEVGEKPGVKPAQLIETHENYPHRNLTLIENSDFLIACTGAVGVLEEILFATHDYNRPTIIYLPSFPAGDALKKILVEEKQVFFARNSKELTEIVEKVVRSLR